MVCQQFVCTLSVGIVLTPGSCAQVVVLLCSVMDFYEPNMGNMLLRCLQGKEHDQYVDVWSLGVLMYEFLVGEPPFEAPDKHETYLRICRVDLHFPEHVSESARDLISSVRPFLLRSQESHRGSPCLFVIVCPLHVFGGGYSGTDMEFLDAAPGQGSYASHGPGRCPPTPLDRGQP